jgi:hypothetical protein
MSRHASGIFPSVSWNRRIASAAAVVMAAGLAGTVHADTIPLTNGNFAQGWNGSQVPGWTLTYQLGEAGAYDGTTNATGSSGLNPYSQNGGVTVVYSPSVGVTITSTAGVFTMDAGDVPNPDWPGVPASSDSLISATGNATFQTMRISSLNGDLGSFYQDTGVKFQPNTTYTLSAYVDGIGSGNGGFSNTGVGLSGGG